LLTRTSSVSKAERGKTGVVANRKALAVNNSEYRPETAVRYFGFAPILDIEICDVEWTPRKADLLAFLLGDLGAGGNSKISLRIKPIRIFPMRRIKAGAVCGELT